MPLAGPRVAVVIITYHGDRYVAKAIRSVLDQSHTDLELVVVEDGSRDQTESIVAGFHDARVRYVWRPNGGLSAARNTGVAATTAPLIAFLDVDDWWHPDKLSAQVAVLSADPSLGAVYSSAALIPEDTDGPADEVPAEAAGDIFTRLLRSNCISGSASSLMVRRKLFEQVGRFDESVKYAEDWECWLRLARVTRFGIVPAVHVFILVRAQSFGRNTEAVRLGCHAVLTRALRDYPQATRRLRGAITASIEFTASVDYSERGMRREAWRPLLRALRADPFASRSWKRLLLLAVGRV